MKQQIEQVPLQTVRSVMLLLRDKHIGVSRGGWSGGPDPPLFLDPPFSSVTPPPPTQPDLTDKCNVNCFLIV